MCELYFQSKKGTKWRKKSKNYHKVFLCNRTIFDAISEMIKFFFLLFCQIFTQTHVAGWKVWWAASTFLLELNFAINVTKIWRLGLTPFFRWAENFWLTWVRIISNSSVLATNVMRRLLNVCSCGMSSLIVFVCFQDRLLWSAWSWGCLLWSLAMSIVRFIWKLSVVLCDNHIAAYMVLARSDLEAFGILQTEHVICNARCMTIWYLLFWKKAFILRGKQNYIPNDNLLDTSGISQNFSEFLVGVLILWWSACDYNHITNQIHRWRTTNSSCVQYEKKITLWWI